ncbi:porin PorA family protein [Aggregatilinea lenta]|uniref:porin PorA family protein n=1 Tax=Aggregatilinea lenta TaxID=913108 RepID=UPI0013C3456F|nr:porin PorA family protein [Aggregatilinea lenta]
MSRKTIGALLLLIGLIAVAAGLVLMLVVVPGMKQWPDDVDTVRTYDGTMPVLLNAQTFEFMPDLTVTIERHVKTEATEGDVALVSEDQQLMMGGQPLQALHKLYAIDRKTMEYTADHPAEWDSQEGFRPRGGLVIGWPIDTEAKDYEGWSDDYNSVVPLTYADEVTHDRSGLETYLFTSSSEPQLIDPAAVQAMGLPEALPKEQLAALIGNTDLSPLVKNMLPTLLEDWPEDTVPLQYYYNYDAQYWIEPQTGVLIDTTKHEVRTVGLSDEMLEGSALAALPEEQRASLRVPVYDLTYQATDASVQDAKADAQDAMDQIDLFGTTIPYAAIAAGAIFALLGLVFMLR